MESSEGSSVSQETEIFIDECYKLTLELVKNAGELALEGFLKTSKQVETKAHRFDFVTIYDKMVEKFLIDGIKLVYPNHK